MYQGALGLDLFPENKAIMEDIPATPYREDYDKLHDYLAELRIIDISDVGTFKETFLFEGSESRESGIVDTKCDVKKAKSHSKATELIEYNDGIAMKIRRRCILIKGLLYCMENTPKKLEQLGIKEEHKECLRDLDKSIPHLFYSKLVSLFASVDVTETKYLEALTGPEPYKDLPYVSSWLT